MGRSPSCFHTLVTIGFCEFLILKLVLLFESKIVILLSPYLGQIYCRLLQLEYKESKKKVSVVFALIFVLCRKGFGGKS